MKYLSLTALLILFTLTGFSQDDELNRLLRAESASNNGELLSNWDNYDSNIEEVKLLFLDLQDIDGKEHLIAVFQLESDQDLDFKFVEETYIRSDADPNEKYKVSKLFGSNLENELKLGEAYRVNKDEFPIYVALAFEQYPIAHRITIQESQVNPEETPWYWKNIDFLGYSYPQRFTNFNTNYAYDMVAQAPDERSWEFLRYMISFGLAAHQFKPKAASPFVILGTIQYLSNDIDASISLFTSALEEDYDLGILKDKEGTIYAFRANVYLTNFDITGDRKYLQSAIADYHKACDLGSELGCIMYKKYKGKKP